MNKIDIFNEFLEKYNIGVYISQNDGVFLGFVLLASIFIYSFVGDNLCSYVKERKLGQAYFIIFILSFIAYILNITKLSNSLQKAYPIFLTILDIVKVLEVALVVGIGIIGVYFLIYYLSIVILGRFIIFFFLTAGVVFGLLSAISRDGNIYFANPMIVVVAVASYLTIRYSEDIRYGVRDYFINLKDNLTCWFRK